MEEARFSFEGPLDLRTTFGFRLGPLDPTYVFEGRAVWHATHTREGPVTLRLSHDGSEVVARAWGAGAAWALDEVPRMVGLGEWTPMPEVHPTITELAARHEGIRPSIAIGLLDLLVRVILQQRVTFKDAASAKRKLVLKHGGPAPGGDEVPDNLHIAPSAKTLHALRYFDYHPCGVERSRAEIIRRVSRRGASIERFRDLPAKEAKRRLRSFSGVGPWTAALVAGTGLADTDAVPTGDYHLPNTVAWVLAREERADDARMLELLEPFRPHRFRVLQLIEAEGLHAPRRGPRMPRMRWKE
ncbi:MAG: DNA-3-methyladenine glycosylase 2 family protein [Myxococcota bacterium]